MTPENVYEFFGSGIKVAKAIDIHKRTFYEWLKKGYIPYAQQRKIEAVTKGKLIANAEHIYLRSYGAIILPIFRYYDEKYGICWVESLHFRHGYPPKITYKTEGKNSIKLSTFNVDNLMQAVDIIDEKGIYLFEGDICLLKNKKKFLFKKIEDDIEKAHQLLKSFEIIGTIYENKNKDKKNR